MCGCLFLLLGAVFPRVALVLLELFTDWNDTAFDSFWIGFIGWLFLPYTTLAYVLMDQWGDPINGFGWVIVMFAFIVDLGGWFGSSSPGRREIDRRFA
jgi:hypothetical protein